MQEKHSGPDDEIDFRALVRSLLRAKWWIIGVTIVAAILAFVLSQLSAVKTYQARAMLVFGQAPLNINVLVPSATNANPSTSGLPDTKGITDLATLDDIFVTVYESPDLAANRQQGLTLAQVRRESAVTISGTNQLILRVTDPDPRRATMLVNLWAQTVADRLNTLYGSSNAQVAALQQQAQNTQKQWDAAEKALIDYLPQSKVDSLSTQLAQAQAAYNSQLAEIHSIDLILSDGGALSTRFAAQQATAPVRMGDALGLLELQQRASEALLCSVQAVSPVNVQFGQSLPYAASTPSAEQNINCAGSDAPAMQVSSTDVVASVGTVGNAQQDLKLLIDSLQAQQKELEASAGQSDAQLAQLHTQLESAQFQVQQLETQRDLAKTAFGVLSGQISSTQAEVAASGSVARVVGKAGPAALVGSKVLTNTLVVAISAFLAVVILVWLRDWWRSQSD